MADPTDPAAKAQLSDAELRTLAYYAIGVSSEGSIAAKNVAYELSFAGTIQDGTMTPVGNSGFSIGTLQTDLGQHPAVATDLVAAYQAWAAKQTPGVAFSDADKAQVTRDLQRDGKAIRADGGRALDETARGNLDRFLASDDGIAFVHDHDRAQVDTLLRAGDGKKDPGGALHQLQQTDLYRDASLDDQARLATMAMKLENQAGKGQYPKVVNGINDGTLASVDDVKTKIDGMLPNRVVNGVERPDYIESGIDHALKGTAVFNALRASQAGNPLHVAYAAVSADPLRSPVDLKNDAARPDARHQYDAVKTLFLQNGQSPKLIGALDADASFGYDLKNAKGRVSAQSSSLFGADDDLVVFDGRGHGTAFVGGQWRAIERGDVRRVGAADQSVDLQVTRDGKTETLLHVPSPAPVQERPDAAPQRTEGPAAPRPTGPTAPGLPPVPARGDRAANDDPLLQQARTAVAGLDRSLGRDFDDVSERMSASLAALSAERGLQRIDHVVLSRQTDALRAGEHVFAVQGRLDDPAHLRAHMSTATATATPVDQSMQRLAQAQQQAPAQELEVAQRQEVSRGARSV